MRRTQRDDKEYYIMNFEVSNEILKTSSYGKFRHFAGNRSINEKNVEKIVESIKKIGWITNPILVTPKLEILDGQHRLEALKRLGMPVEYVIVNNANTETVREMNDKQYRWKSEDFTKSYADEGRTSYVFVDSLVKKYGVTSTVVMRAANKARQVGTWNSGKTIFTTDDYRKADAKLAQYKDFETTFAEHRKHGQAFISGVFFLIENGYDLNEIKKSELKNKDLSVRFYNIRMFLEYIEKIYNYRRPAEKRIYPMDDFKKTPAYIKNHKQYGE